jgi:uncharacterized protein involved in cysteine biosynthesis
MWNDLRDYSTDILNDQMEDCLEAEDYLHCARIRDELGRREKRKKLNGSIHGKIASLIMYISAVLALIVLASWVITSIGNFINSLFR